MLETYLAENPNGLFRDAAELLLLEVAAWKGQWQEVVQRSQQLLKKEVLHKAIRQSAQALLGEGYFHLADWNKAITQLTLVYNETTSDITRNRCATMIIVSMIELKQYTRLFTFLPDVYRTTARFSTSISVALLESGDDHYHTGQFDLATMLYRWVMFKDELLRDVMAKLAQAKADLAELDKLNIATSPKLPALKRKAARVVKNLEEDLKQLEAIPDYDQELIIRQARAYLELKRYWEALLLFRRVYDDWPEHKLAEQGLYFAFTTALAMKREERALLEGYEYVRAFPKGEYWDWITVGLADLHNQRREWEKTIESGTKWIIQKPSHGSGDYLHYLVAYAHFQSENWPKALEFFGTVLIKYPDSSFREPCHYWHALTQLFMGHYTEAREEYLDFLKLYPKSYYAEDSSYRLAVAYYGEGKFDDCAKALRSFLEKYPDSPSRSEALSMLGDVVAQKSELDAAVDYYKQSIECALNMQQRNYATFQMARVFELDQKYDDIISLFRNYIATWGATGNVTEATYWIGNSQMRTGRPREAIETFFNAIVTYGNNPHAIGIDMILRDLVMEVNQKLPPQERTEFMKQLYTQLDLAPKSRKFTLELRLITLFAERMPEGPSVDAMRTSILRNSNITNASPLTLILMGRQATRANMPDFAKKVYNHFMRHYAETDFAMEALKGIAIVKLEDKKYDEARANLDELINRFAMCPEAAWAQKTIGDTYRFEKKYADAIRNYNQVLSTKEWRGPFFPECNYWIGICLVEQNKSADAFAYFQRVYVMYEAFVEWVAKAYIQSALCLEKGGKTQEAINTYKEMLANETLAKQPEFKEAKESLKRLGVQP
jgi:TolA-binding protein